MKFVRSRIVAAVLFIGLACAKNGSVPTQEAGTPATGATGGARAAGGAGGGAGGGDRSPAAGGSGGGVDRHRPELLGGNET